MRHLITMMAVLALAGAASAGGPAAVNVPVVAGPTPVIDGTIGGGEYAGWHTDARTGITVGWQADSAVLYCALRSPGAGWLAIGFGSDGMNGSDMLIAFVNSAGEWTVEEHLGKSFFRHARAGRPILIGGKAGVDGGRTVMEFAMPLALSNGTIISAAGAVPFILAYHKDKTAFPKHTKKAGGSMVLSPPPAGQ